MVAHLLAAVVGVVISVAGAMKITNRQQWMNDARTQNLWPALALGLPFFELLLGALLIVMSPQPLILGAATLLLLIFTAYLIAQIASKSQVPCACFGARSVRPPSGRDVMRNLLLMALLFMSAALS
ncbi:MAG: hypothetical protein RIR69_49 [Actinomycetota bacterium]|jgi:ABC-type tungstate transport system substrate-binding protein